MYLDTCLRDVYVDVTVRHCEGKQARKLCSGDEDAQPNRLEHKTGYSIRVRV